EIQSRRYLGSKSRLLPFLHRIVAQRCGPYESFGDFFAGTGVVAHSFNRPNVRVVANDYLASNAVSLSCWLGITEMNPREAAGLIAYLNALPAGEENYVSEQYGDRYFSRETARKIGAVRDEIDRLDLPDPLRVLSLTSLLYAMDRVARTVGHYDAFRQRVGEGSPREERDRPFRLPLPRVETESNAGNEVCRMDANALAREVDVDILYLDPPYNSRQYSDTYHVLENILTNDKPPLVGVARKRPGRPDRSRYCGKDAAAALDDLVAHARCRWILVSYNNMLGGDKRSNAILSEAQILRILGQRGPVEVFRTAFNSFTSKRELIEGHEERVYVCDVQTVPRPVPPASEIDPTPDPRSPTPGGPP
ncbi:MAG: DNA adenine methylase, partial [Armatimonadetes bacterium]|nr:DNA adenine methylase [Armatimonadota bacterium]